MPHRIFHHFTTPMIKRKKIKGDPYSNFLDIVAAKSGVRAGTLASIKKKVEKRYVALAAVYDPIFLGGFKSTTWTDEQESALLHCYESSVAALVTLKTAIRDEQPLALRNECPYCGIGIPGGYDHYLPKSLFPEFSVHAFNLIPACGKCNEKKGDDWLILGERIFINFYIDSLPDAQFIEVKIKWRTFKGAQIPAVDFNLIRPQYFKVDKFDLIERHFDNLELIQRYRDQAHTEFVGLRDAALARKAKSKKTLVGFLSDYIKQRESSIGAGNWKIALYKAITGSKEFLDDVMTSS